MLLQETPLRTASINQRQGLTLGFGGTFGQRSFAFRYIAGQGDPEVATIRICSRVPTLDPLAPNASTATSSPFVTDYLR